MSDLQNNRRPVAQARGAVAGIAEIRRMADVQLLDRAELEKRKLISPDMKNRQVLNVFRELRTKLTKLAGDRNFIVTVTSVCSKGGTTYMAANLAAVFALDQAKTALLLDCNLYDPGLESLFSLNTDFGLTDYLIDTTIDIEDIIYASGIPRLRVIPVGGHCEGGAEYFSSQKMQEFLAKVKNRYPDRFVFIDAPPIGTSVEARIISQLSDYVILVVPYGKATQGQILESIDAIEPEKFAGIVYNN
jgi:capsular exopolysaccharide synthesis family protein